LNLKALPNSLSQRFQKSQGVDDFAFAAAPLTECMQHIANLWSEKNFSTKKRSRIQELYDEEPSVELLNSLAKDLDIKLMFNESKIENLKEDQFPCILVLENGNGLIIKNVTKNRVEILVNDKVKFVPKEVLDVISTNIQIVVKLNSIVTDSQTKQCDLESKDFKSLVSTVIGDNKKLVFQLCLTATISNLVLLVLPIYIMSVYDRVIPNTALETLWALSVGVLIALGLDIAIRYVKLVLTDAIGLSTSSKIQILLYQRMINARVGSFPKKVAQWVVAFRDIENASILIPSLITAVLIDIPFVILVLILVASIAGSVVLAPIAGIVLIALWITISQRKLVEIGKHETECQNKKTEDFAETVTTINAMKAVGAQYKKLSNFERLTDNAIWTSHRSKLLTVLPSQITMVAVQIVIVLAVMIGVYRIANGEMSVGVLAASTLLVGRVLMPVSNLLSLLSKATQLSKSVENVFKLIDLPQEEAGDNSNSNGVKLGQIDLNQVSFTYPNNSTQCLKNVSFSINPGEKVGIIGRSGCGKSTLLQLLTRFHDPDNGSYNIDHADSRQISPNDIRQAFAYMPQENELFEGSVRENICISNTKVSEEVFDKIVRISGVQDFIRRLPEGYSFNVGQRGERLSGGERQAVALARTLIKQPKLLILDEPTSAMDNTMEKAVITAIQKDLKESTLLLSTHRASVLSIVDRIIWMEQGRIIADGPRQEILDNLKRAS
jgi:ATP-binding cassette subfamily C protein LapB